MAIEPAKGVHTTIGRYTVHTKMGPIQLATDERLLSIEPSEVRLPSQHQRPLDVLLRLGGVTSVNELGTAGPVLASAVNPENAENPELRRYEARFGRDALYTAEFLSELYPQLETGTVQYLAAYQAEGSDPRRMSSRGKIPNHIRRPDDPLAVRLTRETGRRWPWFGGTDTTVQFLAAIARVIERQPNQFDELVVYPHDHERAGAVVEWAGHQRSMGDVAIEAGRWLLTELKRGPVEDLLWVPLNRKDSFTVWTDSPNAFHHRDGILASVPVAPVQLQGQVYDALIGLARICSTQGQFGELSPEDLLAQAGRVRQAVVDRFVVFDDRGTYLANGLDSAAGVATPMRVRTINMGFMLDSAILMGDDLQSLRAAIIGQLASPAMSSPFGIVGRARDEVRFEPFDYHAQVWGFAAHKVANGLRRCGHHDLADDLDRRILRQTSDGLLPENVGAGPDEELVYCEHVLEVARPAPDGRETRTVKERPPAPYAAWTVGAILEITALLREDSQGREARKS